MSHHNYSVNPQEIVAYFDFDGTITYKDTLVPFVRYVVGFWSFWLKIILVLPALILYALNIKDNQATKIKFLTVMVGGMKYSEVDKKAKLFADTMLDKYINPLTYSKMEYHLEHKHSVILVSANLAIYLRYWVTNHNLSGVIATELEHDDGIITGNLATPNCYGPEKVKRINKFLAIPSKKDEFKYSYGYGNSKGDYELLEFVDEGYVVANNDLIPWAKKS